MSHKAYRSLRTSTITDKTIKNLDKTPAYMRTDTIYLNPTSLSYFKNNNIDGLIPTRKQSKEKNRKTKAKSIPQRPLRI